jgi:hypothetical protein
MPLGNLLIDNALLNPAQLDAAITHQKTAGGSLVESLLALELIAPTELDAFLKAAPPVPASIEDTGLDRAFLLDFVLKSMHATGFETIPELADYTKLPASIVNEVLEGAKGKRLVEVLGLADTRTSVYRHALSQEGRRWAMEALQQCQYTGPAPVPIARWQEQIVKQSITNDYVTPDAMAGALAHLVLPEGTVSKLGPAVNSGRAILLYGGVGNGKTSIAEAVGSAFPQEVWLPYCVEVAGQIIKVVDAAIHEIVEIEPEADLRWARCMRPVVVTGGELTLEMLDLSFDEISKTYEAPVHVKATGGVFIVDDFGRQRVRAQELLNRWILPLERRVDYLTLHTGKKIQIPFDELVIFSTNFGPKELVDDAGLRRIPYKFDIKPPDREVYTQILRRLCEAHQVRLPATVTAYLLDQFYPQTNTPISGAHPAFIVEHVIERCRFDGREPEMDLALVREAAQHLIVEGEAPVPASAPSADPIEDDGTEVFSRRS